MQNSNRLKFSKIPSSHTSYSADNHNQTRPPPYSNNDNWNKGVYIICRYFC